LFVLELDFAASVICKIGLATIGRKAKCPRVRIVPYACHVLTAVFFEVACDLNQRLAMKPDVVEARATPAMRLPAGGRNADQERERAEPEILSGDYFWSAASVLPLLYVHTKE
jgi:hypothetical protein